LNFYPLPAVYYKKQEAEQQTAVPLPEKGLLRRIKAVR
jgi:hypothetical protein